MIGVRELAVCAVSVLLTVAPPRDLAAQRANRTLSPSGFFAFSAQVREAFAALGSVAPRGPYESQAAFDVRRAAESSQLANRQAAYIVSLGTVLVTDTLPPGSANYSADAQRYGFMGPLRLMRASMNSTGSIDPQLDLGPHLAECGGAGICLADRTYGLSAARAQRVDILVSDILVQTWFRPTYVEGKAVLRCTRVVFSAGSPQEVMFTWTR